MNVRNLAAIMALGLAMNAGSVRAGENGSVRQRCVEDQVMTFEQAQGRNAWAFKCGYATVDDVQYENSKGRYLVFSENAAVPCDPAAECIGNLSSLAFCATGCFASDQRILFSDGYAAISDATDEGRDALVTLAAGSTLDAMSFSVTPIEEFVVGDTSEDLLSIRTNENTIRVTKNHPMAKNDGTMVRADALVIGDSLLMADGPSFVTSIEAVPYTGKVYNISPVSEDVFRNINIAEGFLTGSVRFQNEWDNDNDRLALRHKLGIDSLMP